MFDTKGIIIEDVILMDSSNWICGLFNCDDIFINNIKLVGQWRYNTDGIDLINSSNAKIQNCFVRSDEYKYKNIDEKDKKYGKTHDISYKNINVYKDEDMADCKL